jgi:pilus assembly protein CpaB
LKPSFLIGSSLVFGAVAAFFVAQLTKSPNAAKGPHVVIASTSIPAGTELSSAQLKSLDWPSSAIPKDVFADSKLLEHRVARQTIEAGELVLESKLAPVNAKGGLAATIPPGKRAISVRVNDVVGVAGFALPGNYVDVLVSAKDQNGHAFSKIVLNRVKVLAVAQDTVADASKPKIVNAVTLELTPEESERLDLARSIGSLSLVLRNEMDNTVVQSEGQRLVDLTNLSAMVEESQPKPAGVSELPNTNPTQKKVPKRSKSITKNKVDLVEEIRGVKESEGAK